MIISITSSHPINAQAKQVERFLETFLPKMRQFRGVKAIYHNARPGKGDDSTLVIWESQEAMAQYRQSELFREALAFEQKNNLPGTREAFTLTYSL